MIFPLLESKRDDFGGSAAGTFGVSTAGTAGVSGRITLGGSEAGSVLGTVVASAGLSVGTGASLEAGASVAGGASVPGVVTGLSVAGTVGGVGRPDGSLFGVSIGTRNCLSATRRSYSDRSVDSGIFAISSCTNFSVSMDRNSKFAIAGVIKAGADSSVLDIRIKLLPEA